MDTQVWNNFYSMCCCTHEARTVAYESYESVSTDVSVVLLTYCMYVCTVLRNEKGTLRWLLGGPFGPFGPFDQHRYWGCTVTMTKPGGPLFGPRAHLSQNCHNLSVPLPKNKYKINTVNCVW